MRRRQFLKNAVGAVIASKATGLALADAAARQPVQPDALQGIGEASGARRKLPIEVYSRYLQWLRTADEIAEAVHELGCRSLDLTVRPYPGHVDPARVAQDLPPFVKILRGHGIEVTTIACPIVDADSPHAEEILRTASELGVTQYWGGIFRYDPSQPVTQQLDALKPRVAKLAALNAKYKITGMYHTYAFPMAVGCTLWDLLYVLREFDPAQIGIHYDTSHMVNAQILGGWEISLQAAGPYVRGLSVKDSYIEKGGINSGQRGPARNRPPVWMPPWREHYVPLGQGSVPLPHLIDIVKAMNFSGPVEVQVEYPDGGAENGLDKISLPREQVLAPVKKDLDVLRGVLRSADLA